VAVAEPPATVAEPAAAVAKPPVAVATPKTSVVAAKKLEQTRHDAMAGQAKKAVAAIDAGDRGLFRKKRNRIERVAARGQNAGVAGMVQRAFKGF